MNDTGSADAVTVTCQASLPELRAVMFWLYTHDRQVQTMILTYVLVLVGAIGIAVVAALHWNALFHQGWQYWRVRSLLGFLGLVGVVCYGILQLWNMPVRAWRRLSLEGPTTLTVSSGGLSWYTSTRRGAAGWDRYDGYAVLPAGLVFVSKVPYIVPRSTVSAFDLDRVLTIAKRHLQPVTRFDSRASSP